MAAGGGGLEERAYRRFLELFLGDFRGPFGAEEAPPAPPPAAAAEEPAAAAEEEEDRGGDDDGDDGDGATLRGGGGGGGEAVAVDEEEDGDAAGGGAPAGEEDDEDDDGGGGGGGGEEGAGEGEGEEEEAPPAGEAPCPAAPCPPPPPPPLPWLPRPLSEPITEEEVEGECLDLCLQQLYKYNCPSLLAAALARATADEVLRGDLSGYHLPRQADSPDGITQIETEKLARLVFSRLHEVCSGWLRDFPLRPKAHRCYETSIHAIKNMRRKMEDKHVCIPDFNTLFNLEDQEEQAYFAVFDGHGGVDAAVYASVHLHVNLVHQECFQQDPAEALCRAFRLTDEHFVQKAARESLRCGTTGVVTFIRGNMLYVAWLGDSQVMLVRRGQAVELMKPHKPDREDEKKRIEALGGCVVWFGAWRVNGSLSVSRAIGDAEHKPYICGEADSASTPLDGSEDYLILACDGFYDTVNPEEAVRVVADHLQENNGDSSMVAHKLVASARDAGSSDNITVIVVFLRDMSAPAGARRDSEWTGNSFQGGQEDRDGNGGGGGDTESPGDCKRAWPQHQVSAPADLGYDSRVDSFTDRTTLSAGAGVEVLGAPAGLDPRKAGAPASAKRLSPDRELTAGGVPKRATLGRGVGGKKEPAAEGQGGPPAHPPSEPSPPPAAPLGGEWLWWAGQGPLFARLPFCAAERWARLARLQPTLRALLFARGGPACPEGPAPPCPPADLCSRRDEGSGGHCCPHPWPGLSSRGVGHCKGLLPALRHGRCLLDPWLLWPCGN